MSRASGPHQRGAALLSVLLVVAAMSTAAYIALEIMSRQIQLAKLTGQRATAGWAAYSAEALSLSVVTDLVRATRAALTAGTPALGAPQVIPLPGGQVTLTVTDATNCLNLNSVAGDAEARSAGEVALLTLFEVLEVPGADRRSLTDHLADWIDADSIPRASGAEDGFYAADVNARRPANTRIDSPLELAAIPGYTPGLRRAMEPFVCARPEQRLMRLNVNTLTPQQAPVLKAVYAPALTLSDAVSLIEQRPERGWADVSSFVEEPQIAAIDPAFRRIELAGTTSSYLEARGTVTLETGEWPFAFLLAIGETGEPRVVWRRFGAE